MIRTFAVVVIAVAAILISPAMSRGQRAGGVSAGSGGASSLPGVTTGSAGSLGTGTAPTPTAGSDAAINQEHKTIDRRLISICRGC